LFYFLSQIIILVESRLILIIQIGKNLFLHEINQKYLSGINNIYQSPILLYKELHFWNHFFSPIFHHNIFIWKNSLAIINPFYIQKVNCLFFILLLPFFHHCHNYLIKTFFWMQMLVSLIQVQNFIINFIYKI